MFNPLSRAIFPDFQHYSRSSVMPSSLSSTIISFLLALYLHFVDGQGGPSGPSGPSGPKGPSGWSCKFQIPSDCGPSGPDGTPTSPAYNACLMRDHSVSEFVQCADQDATISTTEDNSKPFNTLDVLVSAIKIPDCSKCLIGTTFSDYSNGDRIVAPTNYLCGRIDITDLCCLNKCLNARDQEHGLEGVCKDSPVNLWESSRIDCDKPYGEETDEDDSADSEDSGDVNNSHTSASSTDVVTESSNPVATPSTAGASTVVAQTTLPTQSASSSPAGTSSPPAPSNAGLRTIDAGTWTFLTIFSAACFGAAG